MKLFRSLTLYLSTLGRFWQEPFNGRAFRWNILFIVLQLGFILLKFSNLPPVVPLFFSLPWGESQLTSASHLFWLPIFSIAVALINTILAAFFLSNIQFFSRLLVVFSLLFSSLSSVTLVKIISLVD